MKRLTRASVAASVATLAIAAITAVSTSPAHAATVRYEAEAATCDGNLA